MKSLFLMAAGSSFIFSLQASQAQTAHATQANHQEDVAITTQTARVEIDRKEGAALRQQVHALSEQVGRLMDDNCLKIPGFQDYKATPTRFVAALLTFNCISQIKIFCKEAEKQLNQGNEKECLLKRAEGEEMAEDEGDQIPVSAQAPHIFTAACISSNGTKIILEPGKKLKKQLAISQNCVAVFFSNEGALFLKLNKIQEQMMHGLSSERDRLLCDLYMNLFGDNQITDNNKRKFKRMILQSDFADPQKENLCINYFNQTLADIEKELNITPQAIPDQVSTTPQANNNNNNNQKAQEKTDFFTKANRFIKKHPYITTVAALGIIGLEIYQRGPQVSNYVRRFLRH